MIIIKQQQENGARRCLVPQRSKGRVHSGQLWCSKKELKKKAREMENKGMPERERAQSEKKRSGCFRRKGRETW